MNHHETRVYASHYQFCVQDRDLRGYDQGELWTCRAGRDKLAIGNQILCIGTASYDFVRVRVEEHEADPPLELDRWDHVTEAGLDILSGMLLVEGCMGDSGIFFRRPPGHHRVRVCHADLALGDQEEPQDSYVVQFWLGEPRPASVLKRWLGQNAERHLRELAPELRVLLDAELAAGNEVYEVSHYAERTAVYLRAPFLVPPSALHERIEVQSQNTRCYGKHYYLHKMSGQILNSFADD